MAAKSNFWLHVYGLAMDLELEGKTEDERICNIGEAFHTMPAASQQELLRELTLLCNTLPRVVSNLGRKK